VEWTVPATVVKVHDGDTVLCDLDLGWHVTLRASVRIDGIAAPELTTAEGRLARDFADHLLQPGAKVTVLSKRLLGSTEKYGRVLADLTYISTAGVKSFAETMIETGHAKPWHGSSKRRENPGSPTAAADEVDAVAKIIEAVARRYRR
jgi:endonuclease YncB( thermonuclease family)